VTGTRHNGTNYDVAVARYCIDGTIDPTFGVGGVEITPIGTGEDVAFDVAVAADGKIVVAGYSSNGTDYDVAVLRHTTDGTLDTAFDTDGIVTTAVGTADDQGQALVLQDDGKIVVAGNASRAFTTDCPASLLQDHLDCTFVVDKAAASKLKGTVSK